MRTRSTIAFLLAVQSCVAGSEIVFESGQNKVHLIELFTSEGCSSCPPAEAWISQLKQNATLWREFVPVAFHVDYWDHLGWRDRFAAKEWTDRQQAYATRWKASSIYTPGFVLDGNEAGARLPSPSQENVGVLRLKVNGDKAQASFTPTKSETRDFDIYVSGLGFALNSNVSAGENSGRKLAHDFVVLWLQKATLSKGPGDAVIKIDNSKPDKTNALAAWVTYAGDPTPIQATGGWLPN